MNSLDEPIENPSDSVPPSASRWTWVALCALLGIHAGLLAYSAAVHSSTWDESGHLVAGLSHLKFGRFELYSVNPPLVRTIAAAPVSLMQPKMDWGNFKDNPQNRSEVVLGRRFFELNGAAAHLSLTIARWTCIPFSLLGALICFAWARSLFGNRSGLLAATLWCFSPMMLGHGSLITPDVAAAALGLSSAFAFRAFLKQPSLISALSTGIVLGLALLTKTTLLFFLPIGAVVWTLWRYDVFKQRQWAVLRRECGLLGGCLLVALMIVNGFYAFRGTMTRLGEYSFISRSLAGPDELRDTQKRGNRFRNSWMGSLPVPLPREMVLGIDVQKKDIEKGFHDRGYRSYFFGKWQQGGWWYYYLVAFVVKEPLGIWGLAIAAGMTIRKRVTRVAWQEGLLLALPSFGLFALVSSQIGMNQHFRYVLPAIPFLYIGVSCAAEFVTGGQRSVRILTVGSALAFVGSSLWAYPHSLAYFNELAGGARHGYRILNNSNIDWGQDLRYLKAWLDEHPDVKTNDFRMAWFGNFDPRTLEIYFRPPHPLYDHTRTLPIQEQKWLGPKPGWYAVSVNYLTGHLMPIPEGNGKFKYYGQPVFAYFQEFEPVAIAGRTIYIYHLNLDEVNRVRRKLDLPELDAKP